MDHEDADDVPAKKIKNEHPLCGTKFYEKNKILFNIGAMSKHLIPGAFAPYRSVVSNKNFKIQKGVTKFNVDGLVVNFAVPVLFSVNDRTVTNAASRDDEYT